MMMIMMIMINNSFKLLRGTTENHLNPIDATAICGQEHREQNWLCFPSGMDDLLLSPVSHSNTGQSWVSEVMYEEEGG